MCPCQIKVSSPRLLAKIHRNMIDSGELIRSKGKVKGTNPEVTIHTIEHTEKLTIKTIEYILEDLL